MEINVEKYRKVNSSFKRKFVFRMGDSAGFFSEYNNLVLAIHYCLVNKIKFIMSSKYANFSTFKGWTEYFIPFCEEYNHSILLKYNCRHKPIYNSGFDRYKYNIYKKLYHIDDFTYNLFETIRGEQNTTEIYHIEELNIKGTLLNNCQLIHRMIWRYQEEIQSEINKLKSLIEFNAFYIGIHIRSGDKFSEYPLLDIDMYIQKALQASSIRNAFVLTDDYNVINVLNEKFPEWNFKTLCRKDENGYVHHDFIRKEKSEQRKDLIKLFASMDLLEKADVFVGTYSSNPGMNMGYRMNSQNIVGVDFEQWLIW